MNRNRVILVSLLVVLSAGATATASAQEAGVTLTGANIAVDAGEPSTVEATYTFSKESADAEFQNVSGTIWKFPERSVSDITATVNGESVNPQITEESQFVRVTVPVPEDTGKRVEVTVQYSVSGPAGELRAPLWVPEYKTAGQQNVIDMTVTLPDESEPQGDAFPNIDARADDGSVLRYSLLHVPAFVFMTYGEGGGALLDINTLTSLFGILFIVAFFGAWVWYTRRAVPDEGGEPDVA